MRDSAVDFLQDATTWLVLRDGEQFPPLPKTWVPPAKWYSVEEISLEANDAASRDARELATKAVRAGLAFGFYPKARLVIEALAGFDTDVDPDNGWTKSRMGNVLRHQWKHVVAVLSQEVPYGWGASWTVAEGRGHEVLEAATLAELAGHQAVEALRELGDTLCSPRPDLRGQFRGRREGGDILHHVANAISGVQKDAWPLVWRFRQDHKALEAAIFVAKRWSRVQAAGGSLDTPLRRLVEMAEAWFEGGTAFQREASCWTDQEALILEWETRWETRSQVRSISEFTPLEEGGIRVEILPVDDPRGLFLGQHTHCCQHPEGEGRSCAWHGALDKDGRFLVVSKNGKVLAQAWVWRGQDAIVLDNIEADGGSSKVKALLPLVQRAVHQWGEPVKVGSGYMAKAALAGLQEAPLTPTPSGLYTDAGERQLWLVKP